MAGAAEQSSDNRDDINSFELRLQQAIEGDRQAISEVVESLRPYLLLIANHDFDRDLQAKLAPSDLVQSAIFAAQQNFAGFQGNTVDGLRAWLKRILQNNVIDARRKFKQSAKRRTAVEIPVDSVGAYRLADPHITPAGVCEQREQAEMLEVAMSQLPVNCQKVIRWRNWDQLQFSEIGCRLGKTEDAARKLWARSIVRLEEIVKTKFPDLDSVKGLKQGSGGTGRLS